MTQEECVKNKRCLVVTVLPCDHPYFNKESPEGCACCGMLDWWGAFDTEEECNAAFIKQYPDEFVDGVHVSFVDGTRKSMFGMPATMELKTDDAPNPYSGVKFEEFFAEYVGDRDPKEMESDEFDALCSAYDALHGDA